MLELSELLGFDRVNIKTSIKNCVKEYGIEYECVKIISAGEAFIVLETSEKNKIILAKNSIEYVEEFNLGY